MTPRSAPGIFLVGFMGCGKTTVGRLLAARLGRAFVDLDDRIESAAGRPIADIFRQHGEPVFRALETRVLGELLAELEAASGAVVALGGGAFAQPENRAMIQGWGGLSVFLECPPEPLLERCAGFTHRPLAQDPMAFRQLYEQRLPSYHQADLAVDACGSPEEVVQLLAVRIQDET